MQGEGPGARVRYRGKKGRKSNPNVLFVLPTAPVCSLPLTMQGKEPTFALHLFHGSGRPGCFLPLHPLPFLLLTMPFLFRR